MLRWRQGLLGALLLCGLAAARTVSHPAAFIYVYPLPTYYHTGMSRYNRAFEDPTYDADREMMDYWLSSDLVTPDPCNATLFFVPIFTADFVQAIAFGGDLRRQWRLRESTPDCEGCDAADSQSVLANRLTYFTNSAMDLVRELPYWHRSQGADHFWLPTADFSRCYGAPPGFTTIGDMFALATMGELDFHYLQYHPIVMPQGSTGLLINASRLPYGPFKCYYPDRDIVIPSFYLKDERPIDPLSTARNISLLVRFNADRYGQYNDNVRGRLLDYWKEFPYPNASMGVQTLKQTMLDMQRSIFCATPPGQAQWTTRFYRAIVSGCIPVTWYVNMRQPYQDFLGLDYSKFTVNIMPSQLGVTNDVLAAIQRTPGRLRAMQLELRRVQARFSWNRQLPDNAPQTITAMLRARGETFRELHRTCPPRSDVVFYKMGLLETKFQENIYLNNPFMHWVWA